MTASVLLAGNLQTLPDAASASPLASDADTRANFREVLDQYHFSRESEIDSDDDIQAAPQHDQKDSDATAALAVNLAANLVVPQPVTPPAEAPRVMLPFTASFTFRQDASAPVDDATTAPVSTAAVDPSTVPTAVQTTSPAPVILRSTLDVRSLPLEIDTKTVDTHTMAQPKAHSKGRDSAPSQAIAAEVAPAASADPGTPIVPVTSSTTSQQIAVATILQTSSTVEETPVTVSTSTLDRGASILAPSRNAANQYRVSQDSDSPTVETRRTVRAQEKVSDPNPAITLPVPVPEALEPQRPLPPPALSTAPRQDAPALPSASAVPQDSSSAPPADSKTLPTIVERTSDATAAPPTGTIAFAARLTPTEETPAPDVTRTVDSQSRVPATLQSAVPVTAKQIGLDTDLPADTRGGDSGNQPDKEKMNDRFAKPEMALPQTHAAFQVPTVISASSPAPASPLTPSARMDQIQEPPATAPNGNNDITIRIPDSNTDQGTAVRFVERAGEVHVSVRTGDADMAQTLRDGLHDLVNRLEDGGIRTQVWQPGADTSTSQNDSHHPFADADGSNGRQFSSGSNSEQESKQQNKPRWVEELDGSIGNRNFKETAQLLWQA